MKTIIAATFLCSVVFSVSFVSFGYADRIIERSVTKPSTRIYETYVPGYDVIFEFATNILGVQPDLFLSIGLLLYIAKTTIGLAREIITTLNSRYFRSSVTIEGYDDLYSCVLGWLIEHRTNESSRSLMAMTNNLSPWDYWKSKIDSNVDFDFSDWELQVPPRYAPGFEVYRHCHEGKSFWIHRSRLSPALGSPVEDRIQLTCIGRSTKPIKDLIERCRQWDHEKQKACTEIRRPLNKEQRRMERPWAPKIWKRSRPMNSIVLKVDQRFSIIQDFQRFLRPSTREHYRTRGIAYRRGVLLHGPSGTGKTSLSFALAGKFGLSIHCISLSDATLTDIDLGNLFSQLPDPCMVLLEDVDATTLTESRRTTVMNDITTPTIDQGISLSGLLNAIDGVASGEGVILIMTTNHPAKLDDALIRDGRVDLRMEIGLLSKPELRDLFLQMYSHKAGSSQVAPFEYSSTELDAMAKDFAKRLPESTFSGADIQGFLLLKDDDPKGALATVDDWAKDILAVKDKQTGEHGSPDTMSKGANDVGEGGN